MIGKEKIWAHSTVPPLPEQLFGGGLLGKGSTLSPRMPAATQDGSNPALTRNMVM